MKRIENLIYLFLMIAFMFVTCRSQSGNTSNDSNIDTTGVTDSTVVDSVDFLDIKNLDLSLNVDF